MPKKNNTHKNPVTALVERAEALGWDCEIDNDDSSVEFRQDSPAGEDFSFCAYGETTEEIVASIREYADDFDIEEHVKMHLEAKENGFSGVPDVSTLVEDAKAIKTMLNELAWDDVLCGNEPYTLRSEIEKAKAQHMEKYGELGWMWNDEGLPYAIMGYHSCKGSVMDFTEDDWLACKENGWTLDEVCNLCDEERFSSNVETLSGFISTLPNDMPKEDAIAAVEEFYTWRNELLPVAQAVYN